tara:strand:+ start:730 stop:1275 length:546 start_codon:yes stop_codon:yes gene_type:complete
MMNWSKTTKICSRGMITILILFFNLEVLAHGGGLNAQGCHNNRKTGDYHCHRGGGSSGSRSAPLIQTLGNEDYFNDLFANALQGRREVRLNYSIPESGATGYVIIDIETADLVIEGGLDKRSSLDSIQQALFAASLTGKGPAVAIYDTDGVWGKIEHRVSTAAKAAGIKFYWISNGKYQER